MTGEHGMTGEQKRVPPFAGVAAPPSPPSSQSVFMILARMTPVGMIRRVLQGFILTDLGEPGTLLGEELDSAAWKGAPRAPAARETVARTHWGGMAPPRQIYEVRLARL